MGSGSLSTNSHINSLNDYRPGNNLKSERNISRFNIPGKYAAIYNFLC